MVCPSSLLLHLDDEDEDIDQDVENDGKDDANDERDDAVNTDKSEDSDDDTKPGSVKAYAYGADNTKNQDAKADAKNNEDDSLQIALIDFGQAVDLRHPEADQLLRRDLLRVKQFFEKMGITTISLEAAIHFVQTKGAPLRQ